MKRIKIIKDNEKCLTAIGAALKAVNGRATAFTITDPKVVVEQAFIVYGKLASIPRLDRVGAAADYRPAGPGKAYGYKAVSTLVSFSVGLDAKTIYLTDVQPREARTGEAEHSTVSLRPDAHVRYVAARCNDFAMTCDEAIDGPSIAYPEVVLKSYVNKIAGLARKSA